MWPLDFITSTLNDTELEWNVKSMSVKETKTFTRLFFVNTIILLPSNPTAYPICHPINIALPFPKMLLWSFNLYVTGKSIHVCFRRYETQWLTLRYAPSIGLDISLTQWGRVTHICVSKLTILGSDNGLSPDRRQAIIWTNAGILLIGPLRTNFSEMLIEIHTFSFKKMHLKMSSGKWWPFCLGLNVLMHTYVISSVCYICHLNEDLDGRALTDHQLPLLPFPL